MLLSPSEKFLLFFELSSCTRQGSFRGGTRGNAVPIVKVFKNAQNNNSSQVKKKNKNGLRLLPYAKPRVVVQLTLTKIIKLLPTDDGFYV